MTGNVAIELSNISKIYKLYDHPIDRLKEALSPFHKKYHTDFHALKNINLEIFQGEVIGMVGANGAGKSTVLKIIAGVLTPTTGSVKVEGKINAILELGAGLKPEMTGRENVKLHLQINGIAEHLRNEKVEEIIDFADIGAHIDYPVKTYSSGMKSRLGFALATSLEPDILIVDEALSVGDISFKLKSYSKMKNLMKNNCTVLYVSHDMQSILHLCDRAVLIMHGEMIGSGKPKDIVEEYQQRLFSQNNNVKPVPKKEIENQTVRKKIQYKKGFYTADLIKKPKILQNRKVEISDIRILDQEGDVVNILMTNKKYSISLNVDFHEAFSNAMFGIQFKTLNGIYIYGFRDEHFNEQAITKDQTVNFTFDFNNYLLPDTYYLNIAVASTIESKIVYLVEYAETSPFKVINYADTIGYSEYGIVRLDGKSTLKIKERS